MAGGGGKYRHLGRDSAHRQALLRNLVTSLFEHETITTTWHKAKEAQRLAEKLITLGKKNTEASRRRALQIFYTPHAVIPKLFGPLRERYADRPGGYTRVLRIEPRRKYEYYSVAKGDKKADRELKPHDQAPSAILELVDGPKDMRFAITARAVARQREEHLRMNEITSRNIQKVTQFRKGGMKALEEAISQLEVGNKRVAQEVEAGEELEALEELEESVPNPDEEKARAVAAKVDALNKDGKGQRWESHVQNQKQ